MQESGHKALVIATGGEVLARLRADASVDRQAIEKLVAALLDYEEMFVVPTAVDWDERRSVSELWSLRDQLKVQKRLLEDFDRVVDLIATTVTRAFLPILDAGAPGRWRGDAQD